MPALPAISGLLKLILTYAAPGIASILNRLFFSGSGSSSQTALNTACNTIASAWATAVAGQTVPAVALIGVQLEDLSSATAPTGIWVGSKPGTTAVAGGAFPQEAFIIKNGISDRYRGGHSRIYLPGIPQGNLSSNDATTWGGTPATSVTSSWSAFLGNILSALGTAGYTGMAAAVPHYYKGGGRTWTHYGTAPHDWWKKTAIPATPPITVDTYSAIGYNDIVGTQRRRAHQSS